MSTAAKGPNRHPGWVRGAAARPPEEVVPFLCDAAEHRARRALSLYRSADPWDQLDAGADAGGAVELLAKACVATVEPALLAKGGNGLTSAETVLRLRGHGRVLDPKGESRIVTHDAAVALDLAVRLFPKLATAAAGAREALEARNESMHMGIAIPDRVDAAVAGMVRFVAVALPVLERSPERFWGDEDDLRAAGHAAETRTAHVAEVAATKIQAALARHARLLLRLTEEEAARVLQALQSKHHDHVEGNPGFPERCPACGNDGWADVDFDFDAEPDGEGGWDYFQTGEWVAGFRCPVCQLDLSAEECEEVGIGLVDRDEDDARDQ